MAPAGCGCEEGPLTLQNLQEGVKAWKDCSNKGQYWGGDKEPPLADEIRPRALVRLL